MFKKNSSSLNILKIPMSSESGVAKRVVKNTGILYAKMLITVFASLYSTNITLNALGISDYGIFNIVAGVISMLTFLNLAMTGATQRFLNYADGEKKFDKVSTIFNVSIFVHFLIAVIILLVLEVCGYFFFDGFLTIPAERLTTAKYVYQFMIISTVVTVMSVPYDAILNARENMLFIAILGIIEAFLKLAIALIIKYYDEDRLFLYGLLTAISTIILLIIHRIYCHKTYVECKVQLKKKFDKKIFREMINFASWNFLGSLSGLVGVYGQNILLNKFFGTKVNAAQGITNQVTGQLSALANTMIKALNPTITKSFGAGNMQLMAKAILSGSKFSLFLLYLFTIPVILEMPYLFKLWLGNVPEFAIVFCRLYLLRNLIEISYQPFNSSIAATGKIRNYQIVYFILNLLPLFIAYILFLKGYPPYYLYIAALVCSAICCLAAVLFTTVTGHLTLKKYFSAVVLPSTIIIAILFTCGFVVKQMLIESVLRLGLVTVLNTILLFVLVWFFGLNTVEKDTIKQFGGKFFKKAIA